MIIWLASYPRSGNTFFRTILHHAFGLSTYSIHNDDQFTIGADEAFSIIVGHKSLPDGATLDKLRFDDQLWPIKTHHPYSIFLKYFQPTDKIIHIVRDGRESTVSYCHYLNQFTRFRCNLQDIILGRELYGSWASHVQSWLDGDAPRFLIKYESLVQDTYHSVEAIQSHIGITKKKEKIPTFEELKSINPRFFRSGKTDSWKKVLTEEDLELFWIHSGKTMVACGYSSHTPANVDINRSVESQCNIGSGADGVPEGSQGGGRPSLAFRSARDRFRSRMLTIRMEISRITNTSPFLKSLLKRMQAIWPS